MTTDFTVRIKRYEPTDPRLGRHVRHDSRSLLYQYPRLASGTALASIRHPSKIPTLNQGDIGSCTGNAGTKCLATELFWSLARNLLSETDGDRDEAYAVGLYGAATRIDPYKGYYPPTDTGSDGLSIAKVLQARKLISGYQHATSFSAVINALSRQPVIVGTEWREAQYEPASDGRLKITGDNQGGHEYLLDELDVENKRVWMQNSWGQDWGVEGRAYYTWDDFETLLHADGDCTIFTPPTQPAPAPVPVDPKALFVAAAEHWVGLRHTSKDNVKFEGQVQAYLTELTR